MGITGAPHRTILRFMKADWRYEKSHGAILKPLDTR